MAETISSTRYVPKDRPHPAVHEGDTVVRVPYRLLQHLLRGYSKWYAEMYGEVGMPDYASALRLGDVVVLAAEDAVEGGDGGGEE